MNEELTKEQRRKVATLLGMKTAVEDLFFPKDFKIDSLGEFEKLRKDKKSFLYKILREAKLLYDS